MTVWSDDFDAYFGLTMERYNGGGARSKNEV